MSGMIFGPGLDDPQALLYLLRDMAQAGSAAHNVATEDGGLTGTVRDMLFAINSMVDSVMSLVEQSALAE